MTSWQYNLSIYLIYKKNTKEKLKESDYKKTISNCKYLGIATLQPCYEGLWAYPGGISIPQEVIMQTLRSCLRCCAHICILTSSPNNLCVFKFGKYYFSVYNKIVRCLHLSVESLWRWQLQMQIVARVYIRNSDTMKCQWRDFSGTTLSKTPNKAFVVFF